MMCRQPVKRAFDVLIALAAIAALWPLFLAIAIAVKVSSPGPILFRHRRVGRGFRPISVLKYRTMVPNASAIGAPITAGDDPRITKIGKVLRKTKLDELPQFFNVLIGDMSIVGPRPEVPQYVHIFRQDYEKILQVRPGITDPASIHYRDEAAILGEAADPEKEYLERVLPEKIKLSREYARRSSLYFDLTIILRTLWALTADRVKRKQVE